MTLYNKLLSEYTDLFPDTKEDTTVARWLPRVEEYLLNEDRTKGKYPKGGWHPSYIRKWKRDLDVGKEIEVRVSSYLSNWGFRVTDISGKTDVNGRYLPFDLVIRNPATGSVIIADVKFIGDNSFFFSDDLTDAVVNALVPHGYSNFAVTDEVLRRHEEFKTKARKIIIFVRGWKRKGLNYPMYIMVEDVRASSHLVRSGKLHRIGIERTYPIKSLADV